MSIAGYFQNLITLLVIGGISVATPCFGDEAPAENRQAMTSEQLKAFLAEVPKSQEPVWEQLSMVPVTGALRQIQFSPDGAAVVVLDSEGSVHVITIADGKIIGSFKPTEDVKSIALSPDHQHVAVGDQKVVIYATASGKPVFTHEAFAGDVTFAAISLDGRYLMGADKEGTVRRFPLLGGQGISVTLDKSKQPLKAIACAPNQDRFLYTDQAGHSFYCIFSDGTNPEVIPTNLNGLVDGATRFSMGSTVCLAEHESGMVIIRPRPDAMINLHNLNFALPEASGFLVASDDSIVAAWTPDGLVRIINTRQNSVGLVSRPPINVLQGLFSKPMIVLGPDCKTMAVQQFERLEIWRLVRDSMDRESKFLSLVATLLSNGQYDRLEELSLLIQESAAAEFSEAEFLNVLNPIYHPRAEADRIQELEAWMAAHPQSAIPRVVMADSYYQTAWKHRGRGFAVTVTEDGAKLFEENIERALSVVAPLEPNDNKPNRYFSLMIQLYTSAGATRESFDRTAEGIIQFCPDNVAAHQAAAQYLMPRWHGEPGDLAVYMKRITEVLDDDGGEKILVAVLQQQLPYYRDDFYVMTGFEYEPLQAMLERRLKAENLDVESKDQLMSVYSGLARRSEDLDMVKKLVGQMLTGGWMARNQHMGSIYSDVNRTLAWLQKEGGEMALHRSILDSIPLPRPGNGKDEITPPGLNDSPAVPKESVPPDPKNPAPRTPGEDPQR